MRVAFDVLDAWGFKFKTILDLGQGSHGNGRLVAWENGTLLDGGSRYTDN